MSIPFKEGTCTTMNAIHCKNCNKLLGYIDGSYEIKCPRCGELNARKESVKDEREEVR